MAKKHKIKNLRIPGPTKLFPEARELMGQEAFNHRGPRFEELMRDVTKKLKIIFHTKNDILILTASGTGGLEAAIVNTVSPGDKVLAVSIGSFGDRFAQIAKAHGADLTILRYKSGTAADPKEIEKTLKENPNIKTLLITHNETSTGVKNDLETISKIAKKNKILFIVDAVSSLAAMPLPIDKWGIDIAITGSQKGFGIPPGLTMISMSKKAWDKSKKTKSNKFYFDLNIAKSALNNGQTPFTPATHQIDALNKGLDILFREGLDNMIKRHINAHEKIKKEVKEMGLKLLASDTDSSPVVTAIKTDNAGLIIKQMREKGIELAGGYGDLAGKIFRIGHLGYFDMKEIDEVLKELRKITKSL